MPKRMLVNLGLTIIIVFGFFSFFYTTTEHVVNASYHLLCAAFNTHWKCARGNLLVR